MDECPVCLEPLEGTVVHLGCCRNRIHIQCYVSKCPLCRAQLPEPPHHTKEVIVPVPVHIQPTRAQKAWSIVPFVGLIGAIGLYFVLTTVNA